jgi:hypothetical protein
MVLLALLALLALLVQEQRAQQVLLVSQETQVRLEPLDQQDRLAPLALVTSADFY